MVPTESLMPGTSPGDTAPDGSADPAESGDVALDVDFTVEIAGMEFTAPEMDTSADQSDTLTIAVGDTVAFRNDDEMTHTVTHGSDGEPSPRGEFDYSLLVGETASHTFLEPGSYEVTCQLHPDMNMTIVVDE